MVLGGFRSFHVLVTTVDCLDKVLFVSKIISKKIDFHSCATLS